MSDNEFANISKVVTEEAQDMVTKETPEMKKVFPNAKEASEENVSETVKVKLALAIPANEYSDENIKKIREQYLSAKSVEFCSEQFNHDMVSYEIVDIDVLPESSATLFDEVLTDTFEVGGRSNNSNSVIVAIDIGGGSTDISGMQGVKVISSSEEVYNIGVNTAFEEIALRVEEKFGLESGFLDNNYMSLVLRYPVCYCTNCGKVDKNPGLCSCGGNFELKKNILQLGSRAEDISDIADQVYNEKADSLAKFIKRYIDRLFRSRGINKVQLEKIIFSGGGADIFYSLLKSRIQANVGEFVDIVKADKPVWKVLNGLSKYVLFKDKKSEKNFDCYVFVDPGNYGTKAKCTDVDGENVIKPIEMLTKIAQPLDQFNIAVRKPNPMMDLDLKITTTSPGGNSTDGRYFVSNLANEGRNPRNRDPLSSKVFDEITKVMVSSAIAVVLARYKAKKSASK